MESSVVVDKDVQTQQFGIQDYQDEDTFYGISHIQSLSHTENIAKYSAKTSREDTIDIKDLTHAS